MGLAACVPTSRPTVAPTNPEAPRTTAESTPARPSDWAAFDLADFEPPFQRLPLRAEFVRAHDIGRVTVHLDRRVEDAWLTDIEVIATTFDDAGQPTSRTTVDRGTPAATVAYHYEAGRLASTREELADGTAIETRREYDAQGRLTDTWYVFAQAKRHERNHYDEQGRLVQAEQTSGEGTARRWFSYEGDRVVSERLQTPSQETITTHYEYDEAGRRIRQVHTRPNRPPDAYTFTWSADGRLRAIEFTEGERPVYRRSYTYDEHGRPIEERLQSYVAAMGDGDLLRYVYESRGEPPRRSAAAESAGPTHADLVDATLAAFTGAYVELAQVSYETTGGDRFAPHAVTVLVPEAIVTTWSAEDLQTRACTAKTTLGMACDCERVTLGPAQDYAWHSWPDKRVVALKLSLGIGC